MFLLQKNDVKFYLIQYFSQVLYDPIFIFNQLTFFKFKIALVQLNFEFVFIHNPVISKSYGIATMYFGENMHHNKCDLQNCLFSLFTRLVQNCYFKYIIKTI